MKRVYSEIADPEKDYTKASQRRSKFKEAEELADAYDAFEIFKKKSKKKFK